MDQTTMQVQFHESDLMTRCKKFRVRRRLSHLLLRDLPVNKVLLLSLHFDIPSLHLQQDSRLSITTS